MDKQNQKNSEEAEVDPDEHYLGNIWGWKFSFIGLALILFFLSLAIIRSQMLGVPLAPNKNMEIMNTSNPHIDTNK